MIVNNVVPKHTFSHRFSNIIERLDPRKWSLSRKQLIIVISLIGILLVIGIGYLIWRVEYSSKTVAPTSSNAGSPGQGGAVPKECVTLSTANPANDPHCNSKCTNNNCIQYCSYAGNGAKIVLNQNVTDLKISFVNAINNKLVVKIPELNYQNTFECKGSDCVASDIISNVNLSKGSTLTIAARFINESKNALGFRAPRGGVCGESNICNPDNNGFYGTFKIPSSVYEKNFKVISEECVADAPIGDSDFDFNDAALVLTGRYNVCDGGSIDSPEEEIKVQRGEALKFEGTAIDSDGIDTTSIKVELDGKFLENAYIDDDSDPTHVKWSYGLDTSTLKPGEHTLTVSWKDVKGVSGDKCTVRRSFVIVVPKTNECEAGGINEPSDGAEIEDGSLLKVSGWAADSDGIDPDTITVKMDDTILGMATVTGKASGHDEPNAIAWEYSKTLTAAPGSHTITVSWKDKKGATGPNCTASRTIIIKEKEVVNVDVTKTASFTCADDGSYAIANYKISVVNNGNANITLQKVTDIFQENIQQDWFQTNSINPSQYNLISNGITWQNPLTLEQGKTANFVYNLKIPSSSFGTYSNEVSVDIDGKTNKASQTLNIQCNKSAPKTGLLDEEPVLYGILFILFGGLLYLVAQYQLNYNTLDGSVEKPKVKYKGKRTKVVIIKDD